MVRPSQPVHVSIDDSPCNPAARAGEELSGPHHPYGGRTRYSHCTCRQGSPMSESTVRRRRHRTYGRRVRRRGAQTYCTANSSLGRRTVNCQAPCCPAGRFERPRPPTLAWSLSPACSGYRTWRFGLSAADFPPGLSDLRIGLSPREQREYLPLSLGQPVQFHRSFAAPPCGFRRMPAG